MQDIQFSNLCSINDYLRVLINDSNKDYSLLYKVVLSVIKIFDDKSFKFFDFVETSKLFKKLFLDVEDVINTIPFEYLECTGILCHKYGLKLPYAIEYVPESPKCTPDHCNDLMVDDYAGPISLPCLSCLCRIFSHNHKDFAKKYVGNLSLDFFLMVTEENFNKYYGCACFKCLPKY